MDQIKLLPRPTKTYHTKPYPAISPFRPELSLKGRTALVTGGGNGIGLAISKALAQAGVAKLGLLGRTESTLTEGKKEIESKHAGVKVLTFVTSVGDPVQVKEALDAIGDIDVLVLSGASMHSPAPATAIGLDALRQEFLTNVVGQMNVIDAYVARPAPAEKTIIHISTAGAFLEMPHLSAYNASKLAMTQMIRSIVAEHKVSGGAGRNLRAFTFHPAITYTPLARDVLGSKPDSFDYDDVDLPAHFAVWLCSPEADFLSGRFVWAHWDVDELKAKREEIENSPVALKPGLIMDGLVANV